MDLQNHDNFITKIPFRGIVTQSQKNLALLYVMRFQLVTELLN